MANFDAYIKALQETDPSIGIVTDQAACSSYVNRNYSRVPASAPRVVLYPVTPAQVEEIVKAANEYEVPLVVRSSQGDETYHGSSVPAAGKECAAVNLSRMTKIMHIDTRNNMAIIEPGVTFAQLNEALKPYDRCVEHPLLVRAEKSVVASFLDREPVLTPKHGWDTPDPLSCVELVMGNGTVFRTGSAAGPGTLEEMLESGCAISQPQGPVWLDLVRVMSGSQGTLAIATWASVKIRPIGSVKKQIYVQTDDIDALTAYSTAVIRRRLGENIFILNRRGLAQVTGADPALTAQMPKWTLVADSVEKENNQLCRKAADRIDWAADLPVKRIDRGESGSIYLYAGDEYGYHKNLAERAGALTALLLSKQLDLVVSGAAEPTAADKAFDLGFTETGVEAAKKLAGEVKKSGAKILVTLDAHAYMAFRWHYLRNGIDSGVKVLHITQLIAQLLKDGLLAPAREADVKVTYQDPCTLGRRSELFHDDYWGKNKRRRPMELVRTGDLGEYAAPRAILAAIPGVELIEMNRIKGWAYCCGNGAGVREVNPDLLVRTSRERVAEAVSTQTDILVTACPLCEDALSHAGGMKVVDILDLVLEYLK